MLLLLEAVPEARGISGPLFGGHLVAVLLWQPVVGWRQRPRLRDLLIMAGVIALAAFLVDPWIKLVWIALLSGLIAGLASAFAPRQERVFYLAALGNLIVMLFTLVVPELLAPAARASALSETARVWIETLLGLTLAVMVGVGWRAGPEAPETTGPGGRPYDLLYAAWVVVLLLLVVFFGLALLTLSQRSYLASMGATLMVVAALLLAFNWLWARFGSQGRDGGGTLSILVSRYLLSFGLPYESWLDRLAQLSRDETDPAKFFGEAMHALGRLAIVAGARWNGPGFAGEFGEVGGRHMVVIDTATQAASTARIEVAIYTRELLSPAFVWHFKLLIQIAAEFYGAKAREARLRSQQYLRAVHETGARLTHDVKNLLQSLNGILGAAAEVRDDAQVRQLVQRQLPVITQRLAQTLDKLQQPSTDSQRLLRLTSWWNVLRRLYEREPVTFVEAEIETDLPIAQSLFDSVADNFLQNALQKRASGPPIDIRVELTCLDGRIEFSVSDTGAPMEAEGAGRLFDWPLPSRSGLGIGLYQAARQADALGYRLRLAENREGCVRFVLLNAD
ncbi:MAG TPA: ATP-binding protein [Burkholderiales bacterium]